MIRRLRRARQLYLRIAFLAGILGLWLGCEAMAVGMTLYWLSSWLNDGHIAISGDLHDLLTALAIVGGTATVAVIGVWMLIRTLRRTLRRFRVYDEKYRFGVTSDG